MVKKKTTTLIKKDVAWTYLGLGFISLILFTPLCEIISLKQFPLSLQLYFCVFGCIFHLRVALDTEFGAHDRKNEPSEISVYNVIDIMTSSGVIITSYIFFNLLAESKFPSKYI